MNHVLTGAPGSGKTAILRELEVRGHAVVEEAATDVIALRQALGVAQPWTEPDFTDRIVALQCRRQAAVPAAFFDRSPICTLALARYLGQPPSPRLLAEIDRILAADVYARTVFLVRNQGTIEHTAARRISFAESLAFEKIHERTYADLGFDLADVPAGPLAERVAVVEEIALR